MSRDLQPANAEAIEQDQVRILSFFEGEFPSGAVRLWSGLGERIWRGQVWAGAGALLACTSVEETNGVMASGVTVALSGIPAELVVAAITEARQGAAGRIWLGFCDQDWELVADPELIFAGKLDVPQIDDGAGTCTLSIKYENALIELQRPREWRYTHESQQVLAPGDRGFEYVTSIQELDIKWSKEEK